MTTKDEHTSSFNGRFDNLLFVTNSEKLRGNIGIAETKEVLEVLGGFPNSELLDLEKSEDTVETAGRVRAVVSNKTKGIVLIGGYDIIPSAQLNVLSDELRKELEEEIGDDSDENDTDDFIVWSDDIYGDHDGDFLPELPVSRIPDGKSATLILNCLRSPAFKTSDRFGVHNLKRPFAISVFDSLPFELKSQLEVAEMCSPKSIPATVSAGAVYLMLHGHHGDATRFSGEKAESGLHDAFDIYNVPKSCPGTIVFSGCCYGALIALPKADRKESDITLRSRTSEQSIALAFLNSGANAFVGCTGAHYSPKKPNDNFLGKPMHTAFWKNISDGVAPSQALFNAKREYAVNMPHGLTRKLLIALEVKILHQFTCLGLGW